MSRALSLYLDLRTATRAAIAARPDLKQEYARRHPAYWRGWSVIGAVFAVFGAITVFSGAEVFFTAMFVALARTDPASSMSASPEAPAAMSLSLVVVTCLSLAVVCCSAAGGAAAFIDGSVFRGIALAPEGDASLLKWTWRRGKAWLAIWLYVTAHFLGALVWRHDLTTAQVVGVGALWLVDAAHMVALCVLAAAYLPRRIPSELLALAILGITVVLASIAATEPEGVAIHRGFAWFCYALPVGWTKGAMDVAVIRGDLRGWWFLAPLALTTAVVLHWWKRGVRVREFLVTPAGSYWPLFERGFCDGQSIKAPSAVHQALRAQYRPARPRPARSEARKKLHRADALLLPRLGHGGPLERWINVWLTPQEREMLTVLIPYRTFYSWMWFWWFVLAVPSLAVYAFFDGLPVEVPDTATNLAMLAFLVGQGGSAFLECMSILGHSPMLRGSTLLPLDLNRIRALFFKVALLRLPVWLLVLGLVLMHVEEPIWQLFAILAKLGACVYFWNCFLLLATISGKRTRFSLKLFANAIPWLVLILGGSLFMQMSVVTSIVGSLLFVAACEAWYRFARWESLHTEFDYFERSPQRQPAVQ